MELFYGEYGDDGELVRDTQNCILTGKSIQPGDMTINIPNTRYFIKVSARRVNDATPEMIAEALKAIQGEAQPASYGDAYRQSEGRRSKQQQNPPQEDVTNG